jgi:hypothetical protein
MAPANKTADTKAETKAADTATTTSSKLAGGATPGSASGPPSVEPLKSDPKAKSVEEDAPTGQKVADGGGAPVFANHQLVKGIPVVIPVTPGLHPDTELVEGLAVAAAVVPGAPEMIANAQAEFAVENQTWKEGDIKSVHYGQGEVQIDRVGKDGAVETERHRTDERTYKALEKSFEGNDRNKSKAFAKKHFTKETRIEDPNAPLEDDE